MATEHHIDAFDPLSFFNLHDLDRDGILDRKELEAVYGVHHETRKSHVEDEDEAQVKTDEILKEVLAVWLAVWSAKVVLMETTETRL